MIVHEVIVYMGVAKTFLADSINSLIVCYCYGILHYIVILILKMDPPSILRHQLNSVNERHHRYDLQDTSDLL